MYFHTEKNYVSFDYTFLKVRRGNGFRYHLCTMKAVCVGKSRMLSFYLLLPLTLLDKFILTSIYLNSASVLHHTHTILTYAASFFNKFLFRLYTSFLNIFHSLTTPCDISK